MLRRHWIFVAALAMLVVVGAGCRPKPKASPEPVSISISVPYEVDTFDPHATITISNFAVLSNFYEPLVRTDAELKIKPCLARNWETPDAHTWLFELQSGVRFHSGRLLTADDVEYSLKRIIEHPEMRIRGFLPEIAEVKAISPTVVRIRTARPLAVFLSKLNFAMIVPKGSTSESLAQNVDGTGPYRMNGWKKDDFMRLVRNEDYWGPKPQIRDVVLRLSRTPPQAIQDLAQQKSDMAQSNTKELEQVVRTMSDQELYIHNSLFVKLLGFDVSREETPYCNVKPNPFRNLLVRQAIHLAINRADLIRNLSTQAVPANQPVPAFIFGFNPSLPTPPFNPQHSRELLKQAGLPDGFRVTLHTRRILEETARIVADQLKAIGIQVDVQVLSDEQFFPAINRHEPSFFLTRWGCPSGDASDVLSDVFHSPDGKHYGGNNTGRFADPEIDRSIEEADGIQTVEERQLALQNIMKLLMERLPMIPLYTDLDAFALNKRFTWQPRNDSYIMASEIGLSPKSH